MKTRISVSLRILPLALALALAVACTKAPNDAQVTSDIQSKLASDSGLQKKQLTVQSDKGVVTLSGTVDNDAQREAAAKYAASEPGVKTVVNNLQVASMQAAEAAPAPEASPLQEAAPAPAPRSKPVKPSPSQKKSHHASGANQQLAESTPPPQEQNVASSSTQGPQPPVQQAAAAPAPPPEPKKVTVPS